MARRKKRPRRSASPRHVDRGTPARKSAVAVPDALRQAEANYRAAVEHAVQGVFRTTPDGRFLMANQALARMLGYDSPKQLIAERTDVTHQHYVRPEDRAVFERLLEEQGLVRGLEYEANRRDGGTVWLRDNARIVRDAQGAVLYYEGTVEDVTERRRAEQLHEQQARQQAAVARLGEAALAGTELGVLFDCAAALVADTLAVEYCKVLDLLPDRREFILRAGVGWREGLVGQAVVPAGLDSLAGYTLRCSGAVVVHDLRTETRFRAPALLHDHGVVSGMSVVIGTRERPLGALGAYSMTPRDFTADDVNFLHAMANLLATAVGRKRDEEVRRHLLARAISAQEEERLRVARELHDETGQALTALLVGLRMVEEADTLEHARAAAGRLRLLAAESARDVGRIARGLRPSVLDDLGLVPALQRFAEEMGPPRGVTIRILGDGGERLPGPIETTLYRVLQEALTNVVRHAAGRTATVTLVREPEVVRAVVRDDGTGFDLATVLGSSSVRQPLGLLGMRERATLVGGSVAIESRPGAGTLVTVALPLDTQA